MKSSKNIILTIISVISLQFALAQTSMKEPVNFKLKNGITVIIAENTGTGKVYASVTSDNNPTVTKAVSESLDKLLNTKAKETITETFGNTEKAIIPSVKFKHAEANVSSDAIDFNSTFSIMSSILENIIINEKTVGKSTSANDVKTFYAQQFNPANLVITIAGDITIAQAKLLTKKIFGNWKEQNFLAAK